MKQPLPTVRVKSGKKDFRVINQADYDPSEHDLYTGEEDDTPARSTSRKPLTPAPAGPKGEPLTTNEGDALAGSPAAAGAPGPDDEAKADDFKVIKGIGDATAKKLMEHVSTFAELVEHDAGALAEALTMPETTVTGWQSQAKAIIDNA